eukprot:TRINITY_DN37460_c1_g1_i3.p1 TRINITY_DN37460_c1_g1~~TRINITY_DN37460_c1_g1_i3.p1  ORF type:complete len:341 (-),score=73.25 TRINITY_DN37460_c1_g1_i3:152-1174(-)
MAYQQEALTACLRLPPGLCIPSDECEKNAITNSDALPVELSQAEVHILKLLHATLQRQAADHRHVTTEAAAAFAAPPAKRDPVYCGPPAASVPMTVLQSLKLQQQYPWESGESNIVSAARSSTKHGKDDAALEAALRPILQQIISKSGGRKGQGDWWKCLQSPLLCPLTRFPICLLPYPPFKLRVKGSGSSSYQLVDGKYLAMKCILSDMQLRDSDMKSLDAYLHRCKLNQYRPMHAAALAQEARFGSTKDKRKEASQQLQSYIGHTRHELGKLRRIQENRLQQITEALPAEMQAKLKGLREKELGKRTSGDGDAQSVTSSVSTRMSFSSGSSDASPRSE